MRQFGHLIWLMLVGALSLDAFAVPGSQPVQLRFVDSATGYAVKAESVEAIPQTDPEHLLRVRRNGVKRNGQTTLNLSPGPHTIRVAAPGYQPMTGEFVVLPQNQFSLVFQLDPIAPPPEFGPERLAGLHRVNQTIFVGFVVDDETGQPLPHAVIRAEPSGNTTTTDERGYFQIYVPVQTIAAATNSPARLTFAATEYQSEERRYLELWSEGDWIYRIRLSHGDGVKVIDERGLRRRTEYPIAVPEVISPIPTTPPIAPAPITNPPVLPESNQVLNNGLILGGVTLADAPVVPVRIPLNIRVLRQDGVTIDYISLQTYCQRSLPSEWIASWGNYGPGGSGTNCLLAGAVAIRTYAIGFINNPYNANYDICGTTSCQAYNPAASHSLTTAAVNATDNYVMIQPGATRIGYKLTEYSAENNQLGMACGDGFTAPTGGCLADSVCTGETEYGHGRGMCQWGTARWATGRKMANRTSSDSTTNGYPIQDWVWICEHYYPNLQLVQGAPLSIGDFVQVQGTANLTIRTCADGTIGSGINCPAVTTKPAGANGAIVGGPVRITSDGVGYTWWRVQWFDANATTAWAPENWLERIAMPLNAPPILPEIPDQITLEEQLLILTNSASASPNADTLVTDFETFASGTANGTVLFRFPTYSGSTDEYLATSPNLTTVTDGFPAGPTGGRVLLASWSWLPTNTPWLRLTTSGTPSLPNPVIDLTRKFVFDIYTDRPLGVALGIRETGNPAGTAIGANGGTTPGIIEFVGVTNVSGGQPQPTRVIPASNWMTLTFDLPNEPARNFVGGNGVLSTATGLGVLEHLAFVPADGAGPYNVYLDNFVVSTPRILTYSVSNAPAGAAVDAATGVFSWTPSEAQGPGSYLPTLRVTDNNLPPATSTRSFLITVTESNLPPSLAAISNQIVHAGMLVLVTNVATDPDLPANQMTFSLNPGSASDAAIDSGTGVFTWPTSESLIGTTNSFTIRVTDNGIPPQDNQQSFEVAVVARPGIYGAEISGNEFLLSWTALPGQSYRVEYKDNLSDPVWSSLNPDVTAIGNTASFADPAAISQRFYRIQVLP